MEARFLKTELHLGACGYSLPWSATDTKDPHQEGMPILSGRNTRAPFKDPFFLFIGNRSILWIWKLYSNQQVHRENSARRVRSCAVGCFGLELGQSDLLRVLCVHLRPVEETKIRLPNDGTASGQGPRALQRVSLAEAVFVFSLVPSNCCDSCCQVPAL